VNRLLIDENLPATLAAMLNVPCMHVTDLGEQIADETLWNYAGENNWIILTKDADFFNKLTLHGAPPRVVWLRTGNLRRSEQDAMLATRMPQILDLLGTADLVEVHEDRLETFKF